MMHINGITTQSRPPAGVSGTTDEYNPQPTPAADQSGSGKAAVNSFVETLAHEEAEHGLHVLLVARAAVKTPLLSQATGGPKMIEKLSQKSSSLLMISPEKVLDDIDRALAKGDFVVFPGSRAFSALRRLSPRLTWTLTDRLGG